MTEIPDSSAESTAATTEGAPPRRHDYADHRSSRLYQVLAWVGIIAGVLFIVAVIFFSGFVAGRTSGGHHGWHRGYEDGQMGPRGSMDDCPMVRPGGMIGPREPGDIGPGGMMGPGGPGGMMGPRQPPSTGGPNEPRP